MKMIFISAFTVCAAILFSSCQKDNSGTNNSSGINGEWKFVSQQAAIKSTAQYSENGTAFKSITTTEYTTADNKGDFKIEADKMSAINVSYKISTTSHAGFYEDNLLTDTFELPFEYSVPEYNSTATYKKIGSDSVYFNSGTVMFVQSGTSTPGNPAGMKYILDGNKLKMYTSYVETKTETQQGIPMSVTNEAVVSVNLERK